MKKKIITFGLFGLCLWLYSCSEKIAIKDYPVLTVELKETKTGVFDIFEKMELIPLETSTSCLIKMIYKVAFWKNVLYVFDLEQGGVFMFDNYGSCINKIHNIGKGPGEYQYIYDFLIDTLHQHISMLSPFGAVFCYNFDSQFIKRIGLPTPPPNYQKMELLDEEKYIFWSYFWGDFCGLTIVSRETGEKIKSICFEENDIIQGYAAKRFYRSNGDVFFHSPFVNEVFKVSHDGSLHIAYAWNFGKNTTDISKYKFENTLNPDEDNRMFRNRFNNGEMSEFSYWFLLQNQTDLYYYAQLRFAHQIDKHLFYNKQTKRYHLFERTTERILIKRALLITNDFLISELNYDEKDTIEPYLSEADKIKLKNYKEEDNPCLIKFTFKK
jgi:hypothetical protein